MKRELVHHRRKRTNTFPDIYKGRFILGILSNGREQNETKQNKTKHSKKYMREMTIRD